MIGGSSQNRRLALGLAPQRVYKPSAESAAPDSVPPPAPNSPLPAAELLIFVLGCICACPLLMLVNPAAAPERAPRPQADLEQATPVQTEAAIKAKITRMVQDYEEAIQEANGALGRKTGEHVEKIMRIGQNFKDAVQEANAALGRESTGALGEQIEKLIFDLGINRTPSTAAHAAGAGANAARKDLVPTAPSGRPGKGAGKGTEKVIDASESTASGTAGLKVGEKTEDKEARGLRHREAAEGVRRERN